MKMARTIWSPGMFFITGSKLKVFGKEHIEVKNPNPIIVVANHTSYLDIPIICNSIPVDLHFTAKSQVKNMPIFGIYMRSTGMIFIDRSNRQMAVQSINEAAILIREGKNVLMYPEGRRSPDGKIKPFKKGAFHMAIKSGADIVPVAIEGAAGVWPKMNNKITPGKLKATIGPRISSTKFNEATVNEFAAVAQSEVERMLGLHTQPV